MPQLIKNIEGLIFDNPIGNVKLLSSISCSVQTEDYVNLNGFIAFLQNLSKAEETFLLVKPNSFGLKNQFNKQVIKLEIDY